MLITVILTSFILLVFGISFWTIYSLNRDYEKIEKLLSESQARCKSLTMLTSELQDEIEAKTTEKLEPVSSIDN
jgi:cell division protein FtsB